MSRVMLKYLPQGSRQIPVRNSISGLRMFADSSKNESQDSKPGWSGRGGEDHALHRPPLDAQAEPSHQARKDQDAGKEGSDAISRKDERGSNKKAKEEHPEAPEPVIGMNSERGGKGV